MREKVIAGQGNAGSSDFATMVGARLTEGVKVRGISAYFRRSSNAIFVRANSGIDFVQNLRGKKIGTTPGNSHFVLWPIVAAHAGIPADFVNWVTMDGALLGPALIAGQLDAAPFGAQHEARLQKQAKEMANTGLKVFRYADYGLETYSLSMFASDEAIEKDPALLKAFLRATLRGIEYAFDPNNIEEGARYVVAENPVVDVDAAIGAAKVAASLSLTDEVKTGKVALGQFEPDRVKFTRDIATKYLGLKGSVEVSDLYTNALLPEAR